MIMTTPNEFLQFATEMGLGKTKSTPSSSSSSSPLMKHNNGYTTMGLSVLNNLCRLIEQIHELKSENNRLRAHLELVEHVDVFQQRFLSKDDNENKKEKNESITSSTFNNDEEKSDTLSPTNSLKYKSSLMRRGRKGISLINQEDSSSILHLDHDQSESIDSHSITSAVPGANNWTKVRNALKFTLRRKHTLSSNPAITANPDKPIPTISISLESDDDLLQENKSGSKKKKIQTTNGTTHNRQMMTGDETDLDDESIQLSNTSHKRKPNGNETTNSSSVERQEPISPNSPITNLNIDDEALLARKPSKIARYGRKIRSKLDTVKKQFSEQNPSSSSGRLFHNSHASLFDDIGSGLNRALITAQLAPALTKSYQQKMREWQTMQKSRFLVNYRRQSITPKLDLINSSLKTSLIIQTDNEASIDIVNPPSIIDNESSIPEELNLDMSTDSITLGPILSPNQRSLIVHQWREIMFEEISLRHYNEYLREKMNVLKELETNLKTLKTNIFCTNTSIKHQSTIDLKEIKEDEPSYLPKRCRSLQSLVSMPASWILAVQSAAYSDVLDGTSGKTNERSILFNKSFFDQLEHLKKSRQKFEKETMRDLEMISHSITTRKLKQTKPQSRRSYDRRIITRGSLRKLSFLTYSDYPQYFLPDPVLPLQTILPKVESKQNIEPILATVSNDIEDPNKSLSADNLTKRTKRSRFDFIKTIQHSKTTCINQLNSWVHRHRHQHTSKVARKSSTDAKVGSPCSTPTLFASPHIRRFRQRLFKHHSETLTDTDHHPIPLEIIDDSDNRSQYDLPVRVYFPPLTAPMSRHVRMADVDLLASDTDNNELNIEQSSDFKTPKSKRKEFLSSILKPATAKQKRETFATGSNSLDNKCL